MACLFIEVSKLESEEDSWKQRLPVPQATGVRSANSDEISNYSLYIHAVYYASVTVSHIGVGDITANTTMERLFNCFFTLTACFTYAILFGNMTSLVLQFTAGLRSKVLESYHITMDFINKKQLS
jgi:hypothetical protein|mmetsp:Transcript_3664/g.491  ORF Transcript_3664/g.491 Transcript_3664/m.491 type:complete len:125 (-) Transcript_3664:824-1198(-)